MSDREVDKIAAQLQHLAPAAWATTTHVVQIGAIAFLAAAAAGFIAGLGIGLGLLCVGVHTARKRDRIAKERGVTYCSDPNPTGWFVASGAVGAALIIPLGFLLFSPWAWISAFAPQLGAAHQILGHIGIQ